MTNPNIRFLRVIGHRAGAARAVVLAVVDADYLVRWTVRDGWSCICDQPGEDHCTHTATVLALTDPRVLGEAPCR